MDSDVVISVKKIRKSFKVYFDKSRYLKEKVLFWKRNRYEMRAVINDVSFDVKKGEAIGLIGANGCGKSTTLKMLTHIMYPDSGCIEMKGRVSALIELGAGFHPDMSGRENIYTNAAIFGLSKKEIDSRLQTIIDFSELGEYIDNPVRTYSSGMYMRLAFSVAINVDADILLVDEILAVGDAAFQVKCFNKLREIKAKGTTIVIVSHSLGQIEQICDRSIWIKDGCIELEGAPRDVHPAYMDYMNSLLIANTSEVKIKTEELVRKEETETCEAQKTKEELREEIPQDEQSKDKTRWGSGDARITEVRLLNKDGCDSDTFITGEPITVEFDYKLYGTVERPVAGIGIFRTDGLQCYGTNTFIDRKKIELDGKSVVRCFLREVSLLPGEYTLDLAIHTESGFDYDYWRYVRKFRMVSGIPDVGVCRFEHEWKIE